MKKIIERPPGLKQVAENASRFVALFDCCHDFGLRRPFILGGEHLRGKKTDKQRNKTNKNKIKIKRNEWLTKKQICARGISDVRFEIYVDLAQISRPQVRWTSKESSYGPKMQGRGRRPKHAWLASMSTSVCDAWFGSTYCAFTVGERSGGSL